MGVVGLSQWIGTVTSDRGFAALRAMPTGKRGREMGTYYERHGSTREEKRLPGVTGPFATPASLMRRQVPSVEDLFRCRRQNPATGNPDQQDYLGLGPRV